MSGDLAFKIISSVATIAAILLSIFNFRRTQRISDRQYAQAFSQDAYKWAGDVMQVFLDIYSIFGLPGGTPGIPSKLGSTIPRLSVLLDQGRFLFPNTDDVVEGDIHKEEAFRGHSHPILDPLASVCKQIELFIVQDYDFGMQQHAGVESEKLRALQRLFVTEVQKVIKTRLRFKLAQAAN